MFAYLFGLKPWEVEQLTVDQWQDFREFADTFRKGE